MQGREEKSTHHHRRNHPLFFFEVWGSMVYTTLSGPMAYTLFPCSLREMVYTIALFCSVTSGSGDTPREEGCHGGGVYCEGVESFQMHNSLSALEALGNGGTLRTSIFPPTVKWAPNLAKCHFSQECMVGETADQHCRKCWKASVGLLKSDAFFKG